VGALGASFGCFEDEDGPLSPPGFLLDGEAFLLDEGGGFLLDGAGGFLWEGVGLLVGS